MNELQNMVNKINEAMTAIQSLHLQPTESNCGNIMKALGSLREVADIGAGMARKIDEMEKLEQEPQDEHGNVVQMDAAAEYQPSQDALDGHEPCVQEGDI